MSELYEYLKNLISEMYADGKTEIVIDMAHAFRIYHLICDMKQIRNIISQEEDMQKMLNEIKK